MDPEKWKRLTTTIHVYAPMEAVYAAWTTAKGVMGWFPMEAVMTDAEGRPLPPGQPARPGDRFRYVWHIGKPEVGEFLEANGTDRVRYTFGEAIEVTATMEDFGDGSVLVTLVQTQDRDDDMNLRIYMGFKEGWAFYLANLKSVLEGGLDLRDFAHETEHMINY